MAMTISQISAMTGISLSGLRFLEDEGITMPSRSDTNGYREYSSDNVLLVNAYQTYKREGLPLARIKDALSDEPQQLIERLEAQYDEMSRTLKDMRRRIDITEHNARLAQETGLSERACRPAIRTLVLGSEGPSDLRASMAETDVWVDLLPVSWPTILYTCEGESFTSTRAISLMEADVGSLPSEQPSHLKCFEQREGCLHVVFAYTSLQGDDAALEFLLEELHEKGLSIDKDDTVIGKLLHIQINGNIIIYTAEYWVPLLDGLA